MWAYYWGSICASHPIDLGLNYEITSWIFLVQLSKEKRCCSEKKWRALNWTPIISTELMFLDNDLFQSQSRVKPHPKHSLQSLSKKNEAPSSSDQPGFEPRWRVIVHLGRCFGPWKGESSPCLKIQSNFPLETWAIVLKKIEGPHFFDFPQSRLFRGLIS